MRNIRGLSSFVADASVFVEYIIESTPYRDRASKLFEKASTGELELYVSPITLSEVLYVASRIYRAAGVKNPNKEAFNYLLWIGARAEIVEVDRDIAVRAGELRKQLRIALPDCYVIATAEAVKATPLFKGVEGEMKPILTQLRRLGAAFLEELEAEGI